MTTGEMRDQAGVPLRKSIDEVANLGPRFFDGQDSKFRCKLYTSNLDSFPSDLYYENDDVSFPHLLPVLYLLLYACVHWRREAADLRIF